MGSDETAITNPGALEKLTFLTGTGRHRVQIIYFFRMLIGPRTPSGIGLRSGRPLGRMRPSWSSPESSGSRSCRTSAQAGCLAGDLYRYVSADGSARACGIGDCTCLVPTLCDPGETSGPRIDRFPSTRPPWWRRQYRELKKLFFRPPVSVPLISLDHYRTELYSNDCMLRS